MLLALFWCKIHCSTSSETFIEALEDTVKQADGDIEALKSSGNQQEAEAVERETDIVVISGWGAGLAEVEPQNNRHAELQAELLNDIATYEDTD